MIRYVNYTMSEKIQNTATGFILLCKIEKQTAHIEKKSINQKT